MKITVTAVVFIDRRTLDLHQRHDSIVEKRWRIRVSRNHKERDRLARKVIQISRIPNFLKRQAL